MAVSEYCSGWVTEYPDVDREYMETYPLDYGPLDPDRVAAKKSLHLYLHVPFCATSCGFCTFLHFNSSAERLAAYVPNLLREIGLWEAKGLFHGYRVDSVFFGGGTASLLRPRQVGQVLQALRGAVEFAGDAEVTVEAHPNTVQEDYLAALRGAGVNRMTYGIQSFNDTHLKTLEIIQTSERNRRTLSLTKAAGFDSVCMDLMFALPGQTLDEILRDLDTFREFDLDGISCYRYVLDPENPMAADKKRQLLEAVPAESAGNEMYEAVVDTLTREGYAQYTQPDFAKPEKICRYTTAVWRAPQEEQLGLGVGALSYNVNGYSLVNTHSLEEYQACLDQGRLPVLMGTRITPDELMRKYFVLGIKCLEVDTARFEEIFGLPHDLLFHEPVRKLQRLGMVVHDGNFLRLTRKGKIYVDYVCKQFYSHRNQGRLQPDGLSFASMRIGGLHNVVTLPVLTASPAAACSH